MNSITKFAVKYPVSVLMLTLAVCLLGTISYNKLGTDLFPDLKNPALYVEVKSGQRPPEEVEKLKEWRIDCRTSGRREERVQRHESRLHESDRRIRMGSRHGCRFLGFAAKCLFSFSR